MGGGAFSHAISEGQPALTTPRMSSETYHHLRDVYEQRLAAYFQKHFQNINDIRTTTTIPGKESHGDIDFVIGRPDEDVVDFCHLASEVGAAAVMIRGPATCSLAVPDDGSPHHGSPVLYKEAYGSHTNNLPPAAPETPERYAQVDVELCPPEDVAWHIFSCAYGDLGGMIGNITTNLGLTVNHHALVLRFLETDKVRPHYPQLGVSQEESQLELTKDPNELMDFLGMDTAVFAQGFSTIQDFYAWLATCNLLDPDVLKIRRHRARNAQKPKRPIFTNFFKHYLPAHDTRFARNHDRQDSPNNASPSRPSTTDHCAEPPAKAELTDNLFSPTILKHRETAKEAALAYFPSKRAAYEAKLALALHKTRTNIACEKLKSVVEAFTGKKGKNATEIVRALRRFVTFDGDGGLAVSEERLGDEGARVGDLLVEEEGKEGKWVLRDEQGVEAWVREEWENVRMRERTEARAGREGKENVAPLVGCSG
ncbi:hypothetical protein MBLNU230_g0555t1 [Neophaeotheca triangularis]